MSIPPIKQPEPSGDRRPQQVWRELKRKIQQQTGRSFEELLYEASTELGMTEHKKNKGSEVK